LAENKWRFHLFFYKLITDEIIRYSLLRLKAIFWYH